MNVGSASPGVAQAQYTSAAQQTPLPSAPPPPVKKDHDGDHDGSSAVPFKPGSLNILA